MHDRSLPRGAGFDRARTDVIVSAIIALMVGCHPAFAQQSTRSLAVADVSHTKTAPAPPIAKIGSVDGLRDPESVLYDSVRDVFYISNRDGMPAAKDGRAFIARVRADGTSDELRWIDGGRSGVTLHAPKGMAITGDVLWIADVDVVRAFDAETGAPLTEVDLAPYGARLLQDIIVGPGRGVYVSSIGATDPQGRNRVFRVDLSGHVTVVLESAGLKHPNGIVLDRLNNQFLIAPLSSDSVWTWRPGSDAFAPLARGARTYDTIATLIENAGDVADIETDTRRALLFIPLTSQNRVDIFRIAQ